MNSLILTVFVILATQVYVYCSTPNIIREDSKKFNYSSTKQYTISNSKTTAYTDATVSPKKWQVGRVSRKQYEIVNMLWRKTKIFIDPECTTSESRVRKTIAPKLTTQTKPRVLTPWPQPQTSTASFIEFYYLDDNDDRMKNRDLFVPQQKHESKPKLILSFYVNNPITHGIQSVSTHPPGKSFDSLLKRNKAFRESHPLYDFILSKLESKVTGKRKIRTLWVKEKPTVSKAIELETCPVTTTQSISKSSLSTNHQITTNSPSSTVDDKIKFFELYDKATQEPDINYNNDNFLDNRLDTVANEKHADNQTVLLEDVNKNLGHHDGLNQKFVKKHAENQLRNNIFIDKKERKNKFETVIFYANKTIKTIPTVKNEKKFLNGQILVNQSFFKQENSENKILERVRNTSKLVNWSDYPFAAIYIYEPSQIHCDAAAISPHWLVAAGSCLSRYRRKDSMTGRSAFVVYCSANWWTPERISYVKYTMVHPRYHPKDKIRRYVYNIGLIQVVGSMSSCSGWAPISLMSHHFAADVEGSAATAVGWGLDRYDIKYSLSELPQKSLSVYEGIIFSTMCPGNKGYSEMKAFNDDVTKNIYCLLLPHYGGEEKDPLHGSMLLVGGKLIALYIQEERHPFGVQSAQYTSIWRQIPWINEIIKEPEEADFGTFAIDM